MDRYYPEGKINEDDEGAKLVEMSIENNVIIIDFGTKIKWIGFHRKEATQMVATLTDLIKQLKIQPD